MYNQTFIERIIQQGGPRESDYLQFDEWIQHIHCLVRDGECSANELARLRERFGRSFSCETMQGFAFTKPHGYAGDFEIIERIYGTYVCQDPELASWDHYWQNHAAAKAVRNRKSYFHALLDRHVAHCAPLRVLNIASGPGRCMSEWLSANPEADITFDCVEIDPEAIEHATRVNDKFLDRITFIQKNALRYRPSRQYDVIWAAGLFDYFNDKVFASLLHRLIPAISPTGELVIGNFSTQNPSRAYMELFDWKLNHRSKNDLLSLAQQCGTVHERIFIGSEAEGVNLFLHVAGIARSSEAGLDINRFARTVASRTAPEALLVLN